MSNLRDLQRARVVDVAQGEVSRSSAERPRGSNLTKYGKWYGVNGVPWCAIGVCWVLAHAGLDFGVHWTRSAWVPDFRVWARARGRWSSGVSDVRVGDLMLFRGGKHIEIVTRVSGRRFWCVGFNTSWKGSGGSFANGVFVAENERTGERIDGTVHPFYGVTDGMVRDAQRLVGVKVDGDLGPATMTAIKAWQKRAGLTVDGIPGADTHRAMTAGDAIKKAAPVIADAVKPAPAPAAKLVVDGRYGRATHSEVQRRRGRAVDGRLGKGDLADLCRFLGLPVYDVISDQPRTAAQIGNAIVPAVWDHDPNHKGPNSRIVRYLEAYSGATVDRGSWGPELTKRLQIMLNEHDAFMRDRDRVQVGRRARAAGL